MNGTALPVDGPDMRDIVEGDVRFTLPFGMEI